MSFSAWNSSEDSFIVDNSPNKKNFKFCIFYQNEYDLTVLFPLHLVIVGSILPLNIL